jgi:hypothetical protein
VSAYGYRPSPEVAARLKLLSERLLSRDEVEAALRIPIDDAEREEILSLVAWFRRRYPTPRDRLAYVRRAYRRWRNTLELTDPRQVRDRD